MKRTTLLVFISLIVLGAGSMQLFAQGQGDDRGRLCQIKTYEVKMNLKPRQSCVAPYYENQYGACVRQWYAHNAFAYIINEDESLDFGLSYWFETEGHCGIIGNAKKMPWGWRYENGMESSDPRERCGLNITIEHGHVFFKADKDASCRPECGARAYLKDVFLPLDALETRDVTLGTFNNPETFYNTRCR